MPQPPAYTPGFAFVVFAPPTVPEHGSRLDTELANIAASIAGVRTNMALIQRDDGRPANNIVSLDTLTTSLRTLIGAWTPRGDWVTATSYAVRDFVIGTDGQPYVCVTAHTAGVFATDVAANRWMPLFGDGAATLTNLGVSAFAQTLLDDTSAAAFMTTLGFSSYFQTLVNDATAAAAQDTLGIGSPAAMRNAFINADFAINQRQATTATANGTYPVDRWRVSAVGGSRTAQRVALSDSDRAAIGDETAEWAIEYAVTGGGSATDADALDFRLENARSFAGQSVTISFWALRTAGTGDIGTGIVQVFGTGGSPSADVVAGSAKHTLTGSWQNFTATIAVPSVSGKTFGSNDDDYLVVRFFASAGTSFNAQSGSLGVQTVTWRMTRPVIVAGSVANTFVAKPPAVEWASCLRYFETSNPGGPYATFSVGSGGAGSDGRGFSITHPSANFASHVPFRVPKRKVPTVTVYNQTGTTARHTFYDGAWKDTGTFALGPTATVGNFWVQHAIASSTNTAFTWQADAEL